MHPMQLSRFQQVGPYVPGNIGSSNSGLVLYHSKYAVCWGITDVGAYSLHQFLWNHFGLEERDVLFHR